LLFPGGLFSGNRLAYFVFDPGVDEFPENEGQDHDGRGIEEHGREARDQRDWDVP
jgi:hypothetical protein